VTKEVPKFSYDVRTVLVPKNVNEDYVVMETRMVTDLNPKAYLNRVGAACKSVNTDYVDVERRMVTFIFIIIFFYYINIAILIII
jgi:hypothetical protein